MDVNNIGWKVSSNIRYISFMDKIRLLFTPMRTFRSDDGVVSYKVDRNNGIYIFRIKVNEENK